MIYYDKIKVIGSDSSGRSIAVVSLWVDSASSLPAANAYQSDGFILGMGSEGNCIDSGDKYRLDSSGAWQITQAGTGTYTKSEIDTLLAAKQNVLTFDATPTQDSTNPVTSRGIWTDQQRQDVLQIEDRAALVELVDAGAKNLTNIQKIGDTGSNVGTTITHNGVTFELQTDGSVIINRVYSSSSDSYVFLRDSEGAGINVKNLCDGQHVISGMEGGSNSTYWMFINNIGGVTMPFYTASITPISTAASNNFGIRIYSSYSPDNLIIMPMICEKTAWDISHKYIPYCPPMHELYQMILDLQ